jgi:hypothetical protein
LGIDYCPRNPAVASTLADSGMVSELIDNRQNRGKR